MNAQILLWFQTLRQPSLNDLVLCFTNTSWIATAFAAVLLCFRKTRSLALRVLLGLALTMVCSTLLKSLFQEPRPFLTIPGLERVGPIPGGSSFPSSHTAAAFALFWGTLFAKNRWWPLVLLYAVGIALSRLYLGVHYPTDLLGGIVLSLLCCWIVTRLWNRAIRHRKESI